jgi:hypothetical protein
MNTSELSPEQESALVDLAITLNDKLEYPVAASANRAFNLGCSVGLLPVAIIVGATLLLARGNWVAAVIIAILSLLGLVLFANLVALITRNNVLKRTYHEQILAELESSLEEHKLSRTDFDRVAAATLPPGAGLRYFINTDNQEVQGEAKWNQMIISRVKKILKR